MGIWDVNNESGVANSMDASINRDAIAAARMPATAVTPAAGTPIKAGIPGTTGAPEGL